MHKQPVLVRNPDVVLICQVFYPDNQSTSQLFTDLLKGIDKNKVKTTVVSGFPSMPNGIILKKKETIGAVEIRRSGLAIDYKKNLILRGFHYFCYLAGSTLELWKLRKCSLIFGVTNPPFTPVWLWILSKIFLKRYQIMLLDIYPDGLVGVGKLKNGGLITRLWRFANRKAFQSSERVIVLGRDMRELVESVYGVPRNRIDYVPHWSVFQPPESTPAENTQMIKKLKLETKFIIQYSGNMGLWHDIDSIVQVADELKDHKDIHFLMIGDGMRQSRARQTAVRLGLGNMTWLPFQPKDSLSDSLSCCHLAMISQRDGLKGVAVPCKLYGILASGRGVLAMVPAGSEVDLVVREEVCGRTVSPGDISGIVSAILELKGNRSLVASMGENAFRAYRQKYTLDSAINTFHRIWSKEGDKKRETDTHLNENI